MSSPQEVKPDALDNLDEGPGRYAAYLMRLRTLITASSRYIAYSSDIGEAFRPLTSPSVVRAAYGISWAYLTLDVGYAGYKAHLAHNQTPLSEASAALQAAAAKTDVSKLTPAEKVELRKRAHQIDVQHDATLAPKRHSEGVDVGLVVARRAVFQSIASMALPAFTIHSIVRYSAPLFARSANARVRSAGPTVAGLAFVPALPYLFDEPVEHVVDAVFDKAESLFFGADSDAGKDAQRKAGENLQAAGDALKREAGAVERGAEKAKDKAEGAIAALLHKKDEAKESAASLAAKAALFGIGVDVLYLPRMHALLARHAQRLAAVAKRAAPRSLTSSAAAAAPLAPRATMAAALRLADKIGSARERADFRAQFCAPRQGFEKGIADQPALRWLALRWTAKEAAYKALYPHMRLRWADVEVLKAPAPAAEPAGTGSRKTLAPDARPGALAKAALSGSDTAQLEASNKPALRFSAAFKEAWRQKQLEGASKRTAKDGKDGIAEQVQQQEQASGASAAAAEAQGSKKLNLHLSISHDGDMCVAQVVAELVDAREPSVAKQLRHVELL